MVLYVYITLVQHNQLAPFVVFFYDIGSLMIMTHKDKELPKSIIRAFRNVNLAVFFLSFFLDRLCIFSYFVVRKITQSPSMRPTLQAILEFLTFKRFHSINFCFACTNTCLIFGFQMTSLWKNLKNTWKTWTQIASIKASASAMIRVYSKMPLSKAKMHQFNRIMCQFNQILSPPQCPLVLILTNVSKLVLNL